MQSLFYRFNQNVLTHNKLQIPWLQWSELCNLKDGESMHDKF